MHLVESPGYAQGNQQAGFAFAQAPITPNFRDADIRVVAEQLTRVLGHPIVIDPRVSERITMINPWPITPDAFYGQFLSVLKVHGLVALDTGDTIRVVPAD
jgi:general secretion pathway protein D